MDKSRNNVQAAVTFVSLFNETYYRTVSHTLSSYVSDGFLKDLFDKNSSVTNSC